MSSFQSVWWWYRAVSPSAGNSNAIKISGFSIYIASNSISRGKTTPASFVENWPTQNHQGKKSHAFFLNLVISWHILFFVVPFFWQILFCWREVGGASCCVELFFLRTSSDFQYRVQCWPMVPCWVQSWKNSRCIGNIGSKVYSW